MPASVSDAARSRARTAARWVLIAAYLFAGFAHLHWTHSFVRIVPDWVPAPHDTVIVTGLCELAGALALIPVRTRKLAGAMLALYALCVWPANVKHAIDDLGSGTGLSIWYHAPRLIAQPLIIWWALWAGEVTRWPFARR